MKRPRYRVEHSLHQCIYFSPGVLPSARDYLALWQGTSCFGSHTATAFFAPATLEKSKHAHRPSDCQLGSLDHLLPIINKNESRIIGGGSVQRNDCWRDESVDGDFSFFVHDQSNWEGEQTLPLFTTSISKQWYETYGGSVALNYFRKNFSVLDKYAPNFGLIDVSRSEDTWGGLAFGSAWMQNIPLPQWIEQAKWVFLCAKSEDKVRGIYWGNYLGPRILARLGGRASFLAAFRDIASANDDELEAHIWEFENGIFVSLCLNPLSCLPGAPLDYAAGDSAVWLTREFGKTGVLCG